jgi:hypothetical protein
MVYSAGENSELPLLQKTNTHTLQVMPDVVTSISPSMSHPQNFRKQRGRCHIMSTNNSRHSATADEKARDKDSRWALHRRKTNMHRGFKASMSNTDHKIRTVSVLTQHSTVGWQTHCSNTTHCPHFLWHRITSMWISELFLQKMVIGKDVPVYTIKTFSRSTVTSALICNLSRK